MYFNTTKLFSKLKMAKADGSYLKELAKIQRHNLIIIDDFGLQTLDSQNRIALLEIIEDRHNKGSIIVTSQIPVKGWYEVIGDKTIADSNFKNMTWRQRNCLINLMPVTVESTLGIIGRTIIMHWFRLQIHTTLYPCDN